MALLQILQVTLSPILESDLTVVLPMITVTNGFNSVRYIRITPNFDDKHE